MARLNCPYLGSCGGCDPSLSDFETQSEEKSLHFQKTLGGVAQHFHRSQTSQHYRRKATFRLRAEGIGYFQRDKRQHVPIESCVICTPKINAFIAELNAIDLNKLDSERFLIQVTDTELGLSVFVKPGQNPSRKLEWLLEEIESLSNIATCNSDIPVLLEQEQGLEWFVIPAGFVQSHKSLNKKLRTLVSNVVLGLDGVDRVCDLFCGNANLSLQIATTGIKVRGFDSNAGGIACANLSSQPIPNATFEQGHIGDQLPDAEADLVIADPPRSGLGRQCLTSIRDSTPRYLIYVSCDPNRLAAELEYLDNYIRLETWAFDFFPYTKHYEVLALLENRTS